MVLSAWTARRHVAVDPVVARFPSLSRSPCRARGTPSSGGAGIFPLIFSTLSCFLLGIGLQTSCLHTSGNAAVGLSVGLLSESARAARPAARRRWDANPAALAFALSRRSNSTGVGFVYRSARPGWIQTPARTQYGPDSGRPRGQQLRIPLHPPPLLGRVHCRHFRCTGLRRLLLAARLQSPIRPPRSPSLAGHPRQIRRIIGPVLSAALGFRYFLPAAS